MLSDSGKAWTEYISQHNSGTCNNQYVVVDLKRFQPGKVRPQPGHRVRGTGHRIQGIGSRVQDDEEFLVICELEAYHRITLKKEFYSVLSQT